MEGWSAPFNTVTFSNTASGIYSLAFRNQEFFSISWPGLRHTGTGARACWIRMLGPDMKYRFFEELRGWPRDAVTEQNQSKLDAPSLL